MDTSALDSTTVDAERRSSGPSTKRKRDYWFKNLIDEVVGKGEVPGEGTGEARRREAAV